MQTNFQILFSVKVVHSYFENDICNCLQFTPDPVTERILKRFKFKIKSNINGFDLYADSQSSLPDFLNYIAITSGQNYFDFNIETNNPNFIFFTDLPADWLGQIVFNSQDPLNKISGNNVSLNATLTVQKGTQAAGNLKLFFNDILNVYKQQEGVNYSINLKARSTQWQYYIINKSAIPLINPSISGKTDINFKGPQNVKLENGEEAMLFYSGQNDLPLSEVPKYKFDLVNAVNENTAGTIKKNSGPKIIFKGLPTPEPSNMGTIIIDGKNRLTSPMYIYL